MPPSPRKIGAATVLACADANTWKGLPSSVAIGEAWITNSRPRARFTATPQRRSHAGCRPSNSAIAWPRARPTSNAIVSRRMPLVANTGSSASPSTDSVDGSSIRANGCGAAYIHTGNSSVATSDNADRPRGIHSGPWLGFHRNTPGRRRRIQPASANHSSSRPSHCRNNPSRSTCCCGFSAACINSTTAPPVAQIRKWWLSAPSTSAGRAW